MTEDINVDDIMKVVENNGDLGKTLSVVKSGDEVRWLEEGKLVSSSNSNIWEYDIGGSEWIHMRHNHVINPDGNQFLRYGSQYADEEKIKDLILEAARHGNRFVDGKDIWRVYEVPDPGGEYLSVLTGSNGYLVTTIPGLKS